MAKREPIIITSFTGQAENPHIGFGVNVGVDLYTTKGVARLSRKMQKKSGTTVTALPLFAISGSQAAFSHVIWVQDEDNTVYRSTDNGDTWSVLSGNTGSTGAGLTIWQDYLLAFNDTNCCAYGPLSSGSPAWTNNFLGTALTGNVYHMSISVAATVLNICNGQYIARLTEISTFNPASGATFQFEAQAFTMASNYTATNIAFLPTSSFAISVLDKNYTSKADIVIWDGVSTTTASNAINIPGSSGPIIQLLTKNGIVYAITDLEHGVYEVNGTSAKLVDRLALRMSNRSSGGKQYTTRVSSSLYPQGADFLGPELLTIGSSYPTIVSQVSGTGLYPYGIWSVNIENEVISLRFPLSFGDINANYNTSYYGGLIHTVREGRVISGWGKGGTFGIDALSPTDYITDENTVFVESECFEVGTRTSPETFQCIEFNIVEPLRSGEEISFYWRSSLGDDYQAITNGVFTSTNLGTKVSGVITPIPFSAVNFIQIGIKIKTGGTVAQTPQIISAILHVND